MSPKWNVPPINRGVVKLGKVPSQSTSKLVLGFYAHVKPWGWAFLKIRPMFNSISHGFYWPYLSRQGYCVGWKEVQRASLGWKPNEKWIELPNVENDRKRVSWCVGFLFCGCGCGCCLLQINWFKSCVVKACFMKVQNDTFDRFCFDALHFFGNGRLSRSVGGSSWESGGC
jgi:hypothetical protein